MDSLNIDTKAILSVICSQHDHTLAYSEAREALEDLDIALDNDFCFELEGQEYRVISDGTIWETYVEHIKDIVNDCYELKLDDMPDFIAVEVDWEQTAKNAHVDGYGHSFSSYDGSEHQVNGYWIFRTN